MPSQLLCIMIDALTLTLDVDVDVDIDLDLWQSTNSDNTEELHQADWHVRLVQWCLYPDHES